jgi:DNA helicase-2/ATP-dependent DNA helicase PcrA
VVGDDDQSIYGWRGADVGLILAFREHFPAAQIFNLERNYRSTQKILDCANAVIRVNPLRAPKQLWTENEPGEDIVLYAAVNEEEEAEWVVDTIQRQVVCGEGSYGDFAVLYRANAMSRVFEEALMAQSLPYEVVGGMRFFDRAEIKDLVAYLQVVHNPGNSLALRRVINNPTRGIGDSALSILDRLAMVKQIPLFDALKLALEDDSIAPRTLNSFRAFADLIDLLVRRSQEATLPQLAKEIIDRTGYRQKLLDSAKADDARRAENVEELVNVAARFVARRGEGTGLLDFLEYLALSADIDKAEALGEKVSLLTLHSAKGLEFPFVFLVGLEEGLLPHYRSLGEDDDTEVAEERRLLYVGMTRAQRRLWLSRAQRRLQFGSIVENKPSRFLADLPKECVVHRGRSLPGAGPRLMDVPGREQPEMEMSGKPLDLTRILSRVRGGAARPAAPAEPSRRKPAKKAPEPSACPYAVGDRVEHGKFGKGIVVMLTPQEGTTEITVAFPGQGIKKLDARYAKLEKL